MSAVAMLLMSWPSTAVIRNSPASSAYGPAPPTAFDEGVRDEVGRAGLGHRRRERDHARDEDDRRPRDGPVGALGGDHAAAGPSRTRRAGPAMADGTMPVASRIDHPDQDDDRLAGASARAARPVGAPGRARRRRGRPGRRASRRGPSTSPRAGGRRRRPASVSRGPWSSPRRWIALTTRSPLSVTMPGYDRLADEAGARRDDDLGQAGGPVEQRPPERVGEAVLVDEGRGRGG